MKYYDDWHVKFESLKTRKKTSVFIASREEHVFIDLGKPSVDIDLTKNQVEQIPVKLNDEEALLPLSNNRVFDEQSTESSKKRQRVKTLSNRRK